MRLYRTGLVFLLFLAGFAFTYFHATDASGTRGGYFWLLTCLILAVGLIATALTAVAEYQSLAGRPRLPATPAPSEPRLRTPNRRPGGTSAATRR